ADCRRQVDSFTPINAERHAGSAIKEKRCAYRDLHIELDRLCHLLPAAAAAVDAAVQEVFLRAKRLESLLHEDVESLPERLAAASLLARRLLTQVTASAGQIHDAELRFRSSLSVGRKKRVWRWRNHDGQLKKLAKALDRLIVIHERTRE